MELKQPLIDILLFKKTTSLRDLFTERDEDSKSQCSSVRSSKEFSEQKFGAHMSAFIMHQNHMREIAEMEGSERVTKVIS